MSRGGSLMFMMAPTDNSGSQTHRTENFGPYLRKSSGGKLKQNGKADAQATQGLDVWAFSTQRVCRSED